MHAPERRLFVARDEVGGADVGGEHAFFNEAVCVVACARDDALNVPAFVADDFGLYRVKVQRAALFARREQRAEHVLQVQQVRQQRGEALGLGAARVGQHFGHLRVGQARGAVHHGGVELVGGDAARSVHEHVAHHAEAVNPGIERAEAVAQLLRQHGNDAAREIDARGALGGVGVQRAAGRHIVAHVGNRHQQPPAIGLVAAPLHMRRAAEHGIVKVARVFAVYRHQRNVAQVHALRRFCSGHFIGQGSGLRQRRLGKLVRHAVLAHRNLQLHARVVNLAQHLLHAAHGLPVERGRLG